MSLVNRVAPGFGSHGSNGIPLRFTSTPVIRGGRQIAPATPVAAESVDVATVSPRELSPVDLPPREYPLPSPAYPTIRSRVWWLLHNDTAESSWGLVWLAWSVLAVPALRVSWNEAWIVDEFPDALAVAFVGTLVWVFWAAKKRAKTTLCTAPMKVLPGLAWSWLAAGISLSFGAFVLVVVAWFAVLWILYKPMVDFIVGKKTEAKYAPAVAPLVGEVLAPEPVGQFDHIPLLKGAEIVRFSEEHTDFGVTFDLELADSGKDPMAVANQPNILAAALDVGLDEIEILPYRKPPRLLKVNLITHDAHDQVRPWPWADREELDADEPLPFAFDRTGETVYLDHLHMLFAGASDAGKTYAMYLPALAAALDPGVQKILLDGKETELYPLAHSAIPGGYIGQDIRAAIDRLIWVNQEIPIRMTDLRDAGYKRAIDAPKSEFPRLKVIVDEARQYTMVGKKKDREDFEREIGRILSLGRSAGATVLAGTQDLTEKTMDPGFVRAFDTIFCMRTNNEVQTRNILGELAKVRASEIPAGKAHAGKGYLSVNQSTPRLVRSFFVDDPTFYRMAASAKQAPVRGMAPPPEPVPSIGPRFPSGDRINDPRQVVIWNGLAQERTAAQLAGLPGGMSEKPIRDLCRDWEARGWLVAGRSGNAATWVRRDEEVAA